MNITSSINFSSLNASYTNFQSKRINNSSSDALELKKLSLDYTNLNYAFQTELENPDFSQFEPSVLEFKDFLKDIGYSGKPIAELTQDEAKDLVSEDGFFGINKTAQRLSNFVLNGGGDDIDRLRAGRAGIIEGFKQAEAIFGGELPQISHDTLAKALESIDAKISELGYSVLDEQV